MSFDLMKASSKLSALELKATSGSLGIHVLWFRAMKCDTDSVIDRHMHSTFEFHFAYAGSSEVQLDSGSFTVREGEFYLTSPWVYHRQIIHKGYIEFSLNCELCALEDQNSEAAYIIHTLQNAECRPVTDVTGATDLFYQALKEAYYQNAGYYNNICSLTVLLVNAAARAINGLTPAQYAVPVKHRKDDFRFRQIKDYICDNVTLPITVSDIARYMFLSEKQINRIVKEAAGMTAKSLIQEVRFQKARSLLMERTDLNVRQISELLGFSSEYYFNQFFKRLEGYAPGIFRSNVQQY